VSTQTEPTCTIARDADRLDAWVAGDCADAERRELNAHLMSCAACRTETSRLRKERALFAERAARPPADDVAALWEKIAPQLGAQVAPPRSRSATWAGAAVAVAAGLTMLVRLAGGLHVGAPAAVDPAAPIASSLSGAARPEARTPLDVTVKPGAPARVFPVGDLPAKVRWAFETSAAPKIRVENVDGDIELHCSSDRSVELTARRDDGKVDPRWRFEVRADRDAVVARVFCDGHCEDGPELKLTLEVPVAAEITARTVSGEVGIAGGTGPVEVESVSGDLTVGHARALQLRTTSGDIKLDTPAAVRGQIHTVSGDVGWSGGCGAGCEMQVTTVSGDVSIDLDHGSAYKLAFRTTSGDGPAELTRGAGSGTIAVRTVSGDLRLGD
jgi:hypothetical protein